MPGPDRRTGAGSGASSGREAAAGQAGETAGVLGKRGPSPDSFPPGICRYVTLSGETPLLPGPVMLYREGVFIGEGVLPMLSPGEQRKLGFGADDLVKVKRIEVKWRTAEEGLITSSNVDERAFDITIKNLHGAQIPVTILDQMPHSTDGKITVDTLSGMTPATVRDYERRRGDLKLGFNAE